MAYQQTTKAVQKGQSQIPSSSLCQTSLNGTAVHPPPELQRSIGDQGVLDMPHSQETTAQTFIDPQFGHDFSQIPLHFSQTTLPQTKLMMNQPGDVYEQEADQVAEQVMRMTDQGPSVYNEDKEENALMRKQSGQAGTPVATDPFGVPPLVHNVLNSGGGQPLDATTREFMEPRFGFDFSQIRVHADERAAESAHSVSARAYTVGQEIVFGEGQYAPGTSEGKRLIAHELTHTLQQGANRTLNPVAQRMHLSGVSGGLIQRDPDDASASTSADAPLHRALGWATCCNNARSALWRPSGPGRVPT